MGTEPQINREALARDLTNRIKNSASDLAVLLKEAHDTRAWEVLGYETWNSYVESEFDFSRQHANRLVKFAEVSKFLVEPIGSTPTHETQLRPLTHLPPEQQKEVWAKAVEIGGGKPTAKDVQRAVVEVGSREESLSRMGVQNAPRLNDKEPEDSDPKGLWSLKFAWKKAKKAEKTAFLSWISERGEMQN